LAKIKRPRKLRKIARWLEIKGYSHLDRPRRLVVQNKIDKNAFSYVKNYVEDPEKVAKYMFYPFIGFDIVERRAGKINSFIYETERLQKELKTASTEEEKKELQRKLEESLERKSIKKPRPIRYAAHMDGYIYSYYAKEILTPLYEEKIKSLGLDDEVLAYRVAPPDEDSHRKNNCTMAKNVFDEIKRRNGKCIALAFDIASFYDHIDHKNLKIEWASLLGKEQLPLDHYNLFKSLTNYSFIDIKEICYFFNRENQNICNKNCEKCTNPETRGFPKVLFKKTEDFRAFRDWYKIQYNHKFYKNPGLVDKNGKQLKRPFGIPQGSAMSALLSNIYMMPFDGKMKELANSIGALYRRYSDDILFICDYENKDKVITAVHEAIKERGESLEIHPIEEGNKYSKSQCYNFMDKTIKQRPLQYLGFSFDGENIEIRGSSLARYLRKSKRAITAAKENAKVKLRKMHGSGIQIQEKHKKLYRKTLYSRYTHLGKRNFISYAYRAFVEPDNKIIKKQIKHHFERLEEMLTIADSEMEKLCNLLLKQKATTDDEFNAKTS